MSITIKGYDSDWPQSDDKFPKETVDWSARFRGGPVTHPTLDLDVRLRELERRMCILEKPTESSLDKYPALAKAYDEYKTIEKLILGEKHGT